MTKEEIVEAIKEMSVIDLADLVKELEDTFGVSAAAPVAVAAAAPADGNGAAPAAEEEQTHDQRKDSDLASQLHQRIGIAQPMAAEAGFEGVWGSNSAG